MVNGASLTTDTGKGEIQYTILVVLVLLSPFLLTLDEMYGQIDE